MTKRNLIPFLLLLAACSPGRQPVEYPAEYLLIANLDTAVAVEAGRRELSAPRYEIDYDQRRVLFQHPPSRYRFPNVPSGPGARFLTAPVMNPASWTTPTDGVGFEARCRTTAGDTIQLLELEISPAAEEADRVWHDRELPLDRCATPTTDLELRTFCRGNCAGDWAAWGEPRVVYPKRFEPAVERVALLVSIDTLRPDRLGVYGAERETSPELEKLAADGIVFETALSTSPWTIPGHASMLTSTYPRTHGATAETAIAGSVTTLAEVLRDAGWQTAGFVDSAYLAERFGFDRGFEHYDEALAPKGDYRRGARTTRQRLLDWLGAADARPAFVFWHVMDVHGPYGAAAPYGGAFRRALAGGGTSLEPLRELAYHDYLKLDRFSSLEDLVASYDEGLAQTDAVFGGLLDVLRAAGLYDDALIVVTSDHGESFFDHGVWVGHGIFLTDDEVRIPLIVKLPGNRFAGTRVEQMVGLVDVAPTILDALSLPAASGFRGRSLISPAPGDPASVPPATYGYSTNTGAAFLRTPEFKYVSPAAVGEEGVYDHLKPRGEDPPPVAERIDEQLYHLRRDPGEQSPIDEPAASKRLAALRELMAQHEAGNPADPDAVPETLPELSPEAIRQLEALGYVE